MKKETMKEIGGHDRRSSDEMLLQPPGKLLARFAVPAILNMLMTSLYNIVDRVFVGRGTGYLGLSAITVCAPIMALMTALTLLFGMGGSALFSIRLGEGHRKQADEILSVSFALQFALGTLVTVVGCVFSTPLCRLAGATELSEKLASEYMFIVMLSAIPQYIGSGMVSFIRAEGNPRFAMIAPLTGTLLNCVLDPLFIFVFDMGVAGAALATAISFLTVAVMVVSYYSISSRAEFRLHLHLTELKMSYLPEISRLGFSGFIMQVATCVMVLICYNQLSKYGDLSGVGGDVALSCEGIATTVGGILMMFGIGMQQAAGALIGINHGAGRYDRVRQIFLRSLISLLVILFVLYLILMVFPGPIARAFGDVQNMELVVFTMRGYNLVLPVLSFQMLGCTYFQATGQAKKANLLSLVRNMVFNIPLLFILPPLFADYLTALYVVILCAPISDIGGNLIAFIWLLNEDRKQRPKVLAAIERAKSTAGIVH